MNKQSSILFHESSWRNDKFMIDLEVLVQKILQFFILIMEFTSLINEFLAREQKIIVLGKRFIKYTPNSESSFR